MAEGDGPSRALRACLLLAVSLVWVVAGALVTPAAADAATLQSRIVSRAVTLVPGSTVAVTRRCPRGWTAATGGPVSLPPGGFPVSSERIRSRSWRMRIFSSLLPTRVRLSVRCLRVSRGRRAGASAFRRLVRVGRTRRFKVGERPRRVEVRSPRNTAAVGFSWSFARDPDRPSALAIYRAGFQGTRVGLRLGTLEGRGRVDVTPIGVRKSLERRAAALLERRRTRVRVPPSRRGRAAGDALSPRTRVTTSCGRGQVPLGGGFSFAGSSRSAYVLSSGPLSRRSNRTLAVNDSSRPVTLRLQTICARARLR